LAGARRTAFQPIQKIPGLAPETERALLAQLNAIKLDLAAALSQPRTTELLTTDHMAREGESVRCSPGSGGMTVILPRARPENDNTRIAIMLESVTRGQLVVQCIGGQVNRLVSVTLTSPGLVEFVSNGTDGWVSENAPGTTAPTASDTMSQVVIHRSSDSGPEPYGPVVAAGHPNSTYYLQTVDPVLPYARVGTATAFFGLTIGPNYDTAGQVAWEPGDQADGSWWAQLHGDGLGDPPRAYLIEDSLGEGLAYELDVINATSPFPEVIDEYNVTGAAALTQPVTMPTGRVPGDRIIVEMRLTALNGAVSALNLTTTPDWAYMDGESTGVDGQGSVDCIELIIAAGGSNDPGSSVTFGLDASAAIAAHVWLIRGSHPTLPGSCRVAQSASSSTTRNVGIHIPPWREANSLWGAFIGWRKTGTPATVSGFPTDFTTGQGQQAITDHGIGYGTRQLRAGDLDADTWTLSAASTSVAVHWVVPPRETGQIRLSESASIPAETGLMNLFDYAAPARAWDLNEFAGEGLVITSAVSNGPFPEPVELPGANFLGDVSATVHSVVMPAVEAGQGVLLAIASGFTASVVSVADVGVNPRNWQLLGTGAGANNRLTFYYLAPADMAVAVSENPEPIVITISATNAIITRIVAFDDAHPTQLPTLSAFSLAILAGDTTNNVGLCTPVPGDGSLEANYTYLWFLATATEDSIVSAFPASYVDTDGVAGGDQVFVASTTAAIDNSLAYCQRQIRGGSEDPGAATYAASANGRSVGCVVAIIPASAARMDVDAQEIARMVPTGPQWRAEAEDGQRGFPGADGQQGPPGIQGPPGRAMEGLRGLPGQQGDRGLQGLQGERGQRGLDGAEGPRSLMPYPVPNTSLEIIAAGTQLGRTIDGGAGTPVPLTGAEQGENVRFGTLQTITVGGVVALNDDATGLLVDASVTITSITGTGLAGRTIMIRAGSGFTVTLQHGTTTDLLACPGLVNYVIGSRGAVMVRHEVSVWRVVDTRDGGGALAGQRQALIEEFFGAESTNLSGNESGQWTWNTSGISSVSEVESSSGHYGIRRFTVAEGGNGYSYASSSATLGQVNIADVEQLVFRVRVPTVSSQTDLATKRYGIGLADDASDVFGVTPNLGGNGLVFFYPDDGVTWRVRRESASAGDSVTTRTAAMDEWVECALTNLGSGTWAVVVNSVAFTSITSVPTSGNFVPVIWIDNDDTGVDAVLDVDTFAIYLRAPGATRHT
jgi:hypothetical protein